MVMTSGVGASTGSSSPLIAKSAHAVTVPLHSLAIECPLGKDEKKKGMREGGLAGLLSYCGGVDVLVSVAGIVSLDGWSAKIGVCEDHVPVVCPDDVNSVAR